MTDIVERLRELAKDYHQHRPHYTEAITEIVRLREALATSRELRQFDADEIKRLRDLLMARREHVVEVRPRDDVMPGAFIAKLKRER